MNLFKPIGDFFLSAWIWNLTFDWFHPAVTGFFMFLILWILLRRSAARSLSMSLLAQLFAGAVLSLIVVGLTEYLNWSYDPLDAKVAIATMNVFTASLSVALIYALLHAIYFTIGYIIWRYNLHSFLVMVVLSNGLGFLFSYMFIRMVRVWYYVA